MLTIHREEPKPRLVTMGQADRVINRLDTDSDRACGCECGICMRPVTMYRQHCDTCNQDHERWLESVSMQQEREIAPADPIPDDPPLEPVKPNRGRPKKMAKDKDLSDATGVKTIREDDPGEQGAIGSHGQNAPAQTKVPQSDEDKETQANG